MKSPSPPYVFALLAVICFCMATMIDPRSTNLGGRDQSDSLLKVLLGDGRQIFANHFFEKADIYFHSGYYPTFFQQSYGRMPDAKHFAEDHHDHHDHGGKDDHDEDEHEHAMDFLGRPQDWIDNFGRHFYSTHHSHLDQPGAAREILPWLKISAELDPHRIETYTVAAYWLESNIGHVNEAEEFLRQGLKANPTSYEILFDLGKLYQDRKHDLDHARNLWELALQRWNEQDAEKKDPNVVVKDEIVANLAHLEEQQGNLPAAIHYLELELKVSPVPQEVQKQLDETKAKLAAAPAK